MSSRVGDGLGRDYWKLWGATVVSNLGDGLSVIAYPWLASTLTRDPVAIAGVLVASRLPWLFFSLPAGVITDRVDRRRLVAGMDAIRFVLTTTVAIGVFAGASGLNDPADVAAGVAGTPDLASPALAMIYVAAILLGLAEVLRDNSAQTLLPSMVREDQLESANGRLAGAELVANSFIGPPLAGILIGLSLALPFVVDAASFAVAAALVFSVRGDFTARDRPDPAEGGSWRTELREGVGWLWRHPLLRPLAIALGLLNGAMMLAGATFVLFAQETLGLSAAGFGLLTVSGAVGGVLGSVAAAQVSRRLGSGPSLLGAVIVIAIASLLMGAFPNVGLVFAAMTAISFVGVVWNVITVALRQTIIPDHLLGRVNSVYRFLGWGMIPIGTLLGGALVAVVDAGASRDVALRTPYVVQGVVLVLLAFYVAPRLSSEAIESARSDAG